MSWHMSNQFSAFSARAILEHQLAGDAPTAGAGRTRQPRIVNLQP
jgi:hypothetical protein